MSITRRHFMLGTAAGLILPSYLDKARSYLANHAEPLLIHPTRAEDTLFACSLGKDNGFELLLGSTNKNPPSMTVREFADAYCGGVDAYLEEGGWEPGELDLDEEEDALSVLEHTPMHELPNGAAFEYLQYLDLGPELEHARAAGELRFINGGFPGSDYQGVHAADEISLSLLQQRLNDLNERVSVALA